MAKTRMALEMGMGSSLRSGDYTRAAVRAVEDALWRNSISFAEAFGFEKSDMLIDISIGVQKPDLVDLAAVKAVLPYGNGDVEILEGGLDIASCGGETSLFGMPLWMHSLLLQMRRSDDDDTTSLNRRLLISRLACNLTQQELRTPP